MPRQYWLFKTEPDTYSIDHLETEKDQITHWEGVRNYQARNFLRDNIKVYDQVLFYHSNANPPAIAGTCKVVRAGYPDTTAQDPKSDYYDPKASADNPIWYRVDIQLVERLARIIPLSVLKKTRGLEDMMVVQRGSRLSIQPVTAAEWGTIQRLMRHYRDS